MLPALYKGNSVESNHFQYANASKSKGQAMGAFEEREKTLENKYFHDEGLKFRITSRRRKLLGLWAAEMMHLSEEESLRYAIEIVQFGVSDNTEGAVVKKILSDLKAAGMKVAEKDIRVKMEELEQEARRQMTPDED